MNSSCVGGGAGSTRDESLSDMDGVIMTAFYRIRRPWYGCVCGGGRGGRYRPAEESLTVCVCVLGGGAG